MVGSPRFPLDPEAVVSELKRPFGHATVSDHSVYSGSGRFEEIRRQDTVAGHLARLGLLRINDAPTDQERRAVDLALRIALRELGA